MQISAHNSFKGKITKIVEGQVTSEVTIEVAPGIEMTSVITKSSLDRLGLSQGKEAYAVVKSTDVIVAVE